MTLAFTKEGNKMVAEFEVDRNFNLHIEKGYGVLNTFQLTTLEGKYAIVRGLCMLASDGVLDEDAEALVYPKKMRIESYANNVKAIVTFGV